MTSLSEKYKAADAIVTETASMFDLKWKYIKSLKDDPKTSESKLNALRSQESRVELLIKSYKNT